LGRVDHCGGDAGFVWRHAERRCRERRRDDAAHADPDDAGELLRIGCGAAGKISRHDFGVSWQDEIPGGGVVVGNEIELSPDAEAILLDDLERTGAIEYCRDS
jgi:hypothetical protein